MVTHFLSNYLSWRWEKDITMNTPVHLGQVILDMSKILMYEFHYK